ncbi:MAG: hypothetical protein ACRBB6_03080 [Neptuniibacter sp.]
MDNNTRVVLVRKLDPDGTPNGSYQVIETLAGMTMKPNGDVKERNTVNASMSDRGAKVGAKNWDINLPVELKGAGVTGNTVNTPELNNIFQACGMILDAAAMITVSGASGDFTPGEPLTNTTAGNAIGDLAHSVDVGSNKVLWVYNLQNMPADTDAIVGDTSTETAAVSGTPEDALCYRLVSDRDQHSMCEIHTHFDGIRRVADRARGTFNFEFKAGEISSLQFSMKGLYAEPTDENLPSATYSEVEPPFAENAGLTIEGYPTADNTIDKFNFSLGQSVVAVSDINSPNGRHSYRIAGKRKPNGSIDPEVIALSEFNPFDLWTNGTRAPIHGTLGTAPGERISVVVTQAQFTAISDKERAGNDVYDLSYRATGDNDNEFYMFFH